MDGWNYMSDRGLLHLRRESVVLSMYSMYDHDNSKLSCFYCSGEFDQFSILDKKVNTNSTATRNLQ